MIHPVNAHELAQIASKVGADILEGVLRYPSDTGGWSLGDLHLSEHRDRYRDQRPVLIIAPVGEAEPATYTCGVCGFVMNEAGDGLVRKLIAEQVAGDQEQKMQSLIDEVEAFLSEDEGELPGWS